MLRIDIKVMIISYFSVPFYISILEPEMEFRFLYLSDTGLVTLLLGGRKHQ
jgi:hypothetical protein